MRTKGTQTHIARHRLVARRSAAFRRLVIGTVIEGKSEPSFHLPASHLDFLDEKTEKILTLLESEAVEALQYLPCESLDMSS